MKSFFFPPRNLRDELLDLDEASYEEVKDSLRDIECGLEQHKSKWYHIGIEKIKRSTISEANNRVPYQVYETLFYAMLKKCHNISQNTKVQFKKTLYA